MCAPPMRIKCTPHVNGGTGFPGCWGGMLSKEGEVPVVELGEHAIRMHPLFDQAVLGATPCGRLVYSTAACESLLVRDGWCPQDAMIHVVNMSTNPIDLDVS